MTNNKQQTAVDSIIEFCQKQMDNDSSIHKGVYLSIIKFCKEQITEESEIHWKTTLVTMTNNKQQTVVEWYISKIKEARILCDDPSMEMDIRHTLEVLIKKGEQAKERYNDEIEAAAIISSATESTIKASSYAEGYTEGYKRAVELAKHQITQIEVKQVKSISTLKTTTTGTTRLCTVFVPNEFVFQNRCKNCGNERHQHIIPTNTK